MLSEVILDLQRFTFAENHEVITEQDSIVEVQVAEQKRVPRFPRARNLQKSRPLQKAAICVNEDKPSYPLITEHVPKGALATEVQGGAAAGLPGKSAGCTDGRPSRKSCF